MMKRTWFGERWPYNLAALGFHVPVLAFALRTALASFMALGIAYAAGLEHPHWAAMSVWASSQPLREHLLSRSIHRFAGTVVGVAFAVMLVVAAQDSLWVLAAGLAFWVGLCAFLGNLQRGYLVYGCMLAGYSAAMVALLHHGPVESIWPLAWDRLLTVLTGVLTALCISWFFAPSRNPSVLIAQSRQALSDVLEAVMLGMTDSSNKKRTDAHGLMLKLSKVEDALELYAEGSRAAGNTSKAMRGQLNAALDVVHQLMLERVIDRHEKGKAVAIPISADNASAQQWIASLNALIAELRLAPVADVNTLDVALQRAAQAYRFFLSERSVTGIASSSETTPLQHLLEEMRYALRAEQRDISGTRQPVRMEVLPERRVAAPSMHRDWVGAWEAGIRAGGTLLCVGVLWAVTEMPLIGFAMLGLSVMLLVFSAFEHPHRTVAFVLRGQCIGACLALICQWLIWPLAQSGWQMVWMLLPFCLIGGLVFAHKRLAAGAMDTNMAMLILLAPVFPYHLDLGSSTTMALAVISGPALAWIVYRGIYPTDGHRRMRTLAQMMLGEVPGLAQRMVDAPSRSISSQREGMWRAQLHHRMLRLVRWAEKNDYPFRDRLPELGLALRSLHETLLELQQWRCTADMNHSGQARTMRLAEIALRRTVQAGSVTGELAQSKTANAWQRLAGCPDLPPALVARLQLAAHRYWPDWWQAHSALMG